MPLRMPVVDKDLETWSEPLARHDFDGVRFSASTPAEEAADGGRTPEAVDGERTRPLTDEQREGQAELSTDCQGSRGCNGLPRERGGGICRRSTVWICGLCGASDPFKFCATAGGPISLRVPEACTGPPVVASTPRRR